MTKSDFDLLVSGLIESGYSDEIIWQRELKECDNSIDFFMEACFVILNSGMKAQIAVKIWEKIKYAWSINLDISEVFGHEGKVAAIKYIKKNCVRLFGEYIESTDKIAYLETLPFIGKITKFHLAKNLGHNCIKPDRHLVRIAQMYNTTPDELCENLSKETGEKKCVIDIILWRSANLGWI